MGGGTWSASTYASTTGAKVRSGTTFGYSNATKSKSTSSWKVHEDLDPKKTAGDTSPLAGQVVRESRDSDDHPTSVPVAVFFDETGSMGHIPVVVQTKLAGLFGLLLRKGYLEDPQILVGAYGDTYCDYVPLQVSQFESDNRVDDALDKIFIEGNGGGNMGESMDLAWYYLAHHTVTDAYEQRGKKGYAFFIGDEIAHGVTEADVKKHIAGPDTAIASDLSHKGIVKALTDKWDAYVLVIDNHAARSQKSIEFYRNLFGERVLVVEDADSIAETIALTIGVLEGTVDLDAGVDDLKSIGATDSVIKSASKALAHIGAGSGSGAVAVADAPLDLSDDRSGNSRI